MDEKVLEEIRFHQDVVTKDANSPLYQIREKEMEISGRVLAARNQGEKMIADARTKAADLLRKTEADAERKAKERSEKVLTAAEASVETVKKDGAEAVAGLEKELSVRQSAAADYVVKLVTAV